MIYRFGEFELDEPAGELRRGRDAVAIQPKPLALLLLLIQERNRIVSIDELLDRLWPGETVTPNSLSRAVSVARSAIGDSGRSQQIRSYTRRGYRFHADVVEVDGDEAAATPAVPDREPGQDGGIPFVGRADAFARLDAVWTRAARGHGGIALVMGTAGIGKSRLCEVFGQDIERRGGLVLRGRALEEEGEPAFWVWAQVLRGLHVHEPDSLAAIEQADTGELAVLMPELAGREPVASSATLPMDQRRFVFFDAVARVLSRAAQSRPLMVLFEDLHWADSASLRMMEHLAYELVGAPVLLVATCRDEPPGGDAVANRTLSVLRRQERCEPIHLLGLTSADIRDLVERTAGAASPELAERLQARTEGVPLFLREALRRLSERGDLAEGASLDSEFPLGHVDWVGGALDSLSPACAQLVGAAAVIGRDFPLSLVAYVGDVARESALDLLDEAAGLGVVESDPDAPAGYRFMHDLFRQAAYERLGTGNRALLHRRTAERLEQQYAEEVDRVIADLAHHHHRALAVGDPERAYQCAARAAERAFELCAYEKAAVHWNQALAALDSAERADPLRRLDTYLGLGEASRLAGERTQRREFFGEALNLARTLDHPLGFATAAIGLCDLAEWGVRDDLARAALEESRERLARSGLAKAQIEERTLAELEARILTRLGYLDALHDGERAEAFLRQAVQIARELGNPEILEESLYSIHFFLGGPDRAQERIEALEELRQSAATARDPVAAVIALLDGACDRLERGGLEEAGMLRREADSIAARPEHPRTVWHRLVFDTGMALLEGRFDEVEGRAEEALLLGRRIQHPYAVGCATAHRTRLHLERGNFAEAFATIAPALTRAQGPGDWVKTLAARAHLGLGDRDSAWELYAPLRESGFAQVPRNLRWTATVIEIAHCCAELEDEESAAELIDLLSPVEHHHAVMPMVISYCGPASFALARLHELRSQATEAEELYKEALSATAELGARPTEARILLAQGMFLKRRGKSGTARAQLAAAAALAADLGMTQTHAEASRRLES